MFEPTPGCQRAVQEAVKCLQSSGHRVIPYKPTGLDIAMELRVKFASSDLGETNRLQLSFGPRYFFDKYLVVSTTGSS